MDERIGPTTLEQRILNLERKDTFFLGILESIARTLRYDGTALEKINTCLFADQEKIKLLTSKHESAGAYSKMLSDIIDELYREFWDALHRIEALEKHISDSAVAETFDSRPLGSSKKIETATLIVDGVVYEPCTECDGTTCTDPQYICIIPKKEQPKKKKTKKSAVKSAKKTRR